MNAKINKRHRVALWLSFLAESALCAPENKLGVVLWVLAAPLSLAVFRALPERALRPKRPSWLVTAAAALLGVFLAVCFFDRWTIVTPVQGLFWRLGLDIGFWMQALAIALLVLAVPFLLWSGGHLGAAAEALEARYGGKAAVLTLVTLEAVLLHYALQTSSQQPLFPAKGTYIVPALLLMLAILLVLALVLGRFGRAMLVGSVLCTLWAAANHYVLLFHGSPLFVSELANTRTALNVISGYTFLPDRTLVEILLLLPVELALGKSAEAVAHDPAVFRGDASHRDAEPDHALPPDSVLFHELQQSRGEPLGGRFRRRSGLKRDFLRENHTAVQPDAREDRLAKVNQNAQTAGHLRVEVDQDLPPAGVAAAEHLALHQQAVRDHLADDLGDGRRGQVHVLRKPLARHGALLMENPQRRAPVAALHAH